MQECLGEVNNNFYEFIVSGNTITTAAGDTLAVRHDCKTNTIYFADAVGRLCEDGTFSVTSRSSTTVYQRFVPPNPEDVAMLEGQWFWQDKDRPHDTSLLTIQGARWTIVNHQSHKVVHGLLHRRTSDGAVTLRTCDIRASSKGHLKLRMPTGSTLRYSRCQQMLSPVREESNEERTRRRNNRRRCTPAAAKHQQGTRADEGRPHLLEAPFRT